MYVHLLEQPQKLFNSHAYYSRSCKKSVNASLKPRTVKKSTSLGAFSDEKWMKFANDFHQFCTMCKKEKINAKSKYKGEPKWLKKRNKNWVNKPK